MENNTKKKGLGPLKYLIISAFIILFIWIGVKYIAYKRYNAPTDHSFQISDQIDIHYHNQLKVQQYYENVYRLSSFANEQWYNYEIDVMYPDHENMQSILANKTYLQMVSTTKHLEGLLSKSSELKEDGLDNEAIRTIEQTGQTAEEYLLSKKFARLELKEGDKGEDVKAIQVELNKLGFEIPKTGLYSNLTKSAIITFQQKNQLFPTGIVDQQTIQKLLHQN